MDELSRQLLQGQSSQFGSVVFDAGNGLWHVSMRIVGAHGLGALIDRSEPCLADAISAWYAEVVVADWNDEGELFARYPCAKLNGDGRVLFELGVGDHCVLVRVNYGCKIVLIESIGPCADASRPRLARKVRVYP